MIVQIGRSLQKGSLQSRASRDRRFSKTVIFRRSTFNLKSPSILRLNKIFNDNPSPVTLKYFGDHGDLGEQFGKSRLLSVSCINSHGFSTKHFIRCLCAVEQKQTKWIRENLKKNSKIHYIYQKRGWGGVRILSKPKIFYKLWH